MKRAMILAAAAMMASFCASCGSTQAGDLRYAASAWPGGLPTERYVVVASSPSGFFTPDLTATTGGTAAKSAAASAMAQSETAFATATVEFQAKAVETAAKSVPVSAASAQTINAEAAKFMVKASKYYSSYGFSNNRYKHTSAELKMLAIVIHMEARGESYKAKLAVGNVVMNRVLASGYPGSNIKAVVTRPNQFCYKATVNPTAECMRAARDVLENEAWVVPQNTYFFRSTRSKSNWGRHQYWGHIGNTAFYQDKYSGRYNGSAVPAKLFDRTYKWPQYGCKPEARVRKLQTMLKGLGYKVTVDGYFGTQTKSALLRFQADNRLKADGIAGPATLRAMIKKYGVQKLAAAIFRKPAM